MDDTSGYQPSERADHSSFEYAPQYQFATWNAPSSVVSYRSVFPSHVAFRPSPRSRIGVGSSPSQSSYDFIDQLSNDPADPERDWHTTAFPSLVSPFAVENKPTAVNSDLVPTITRYVKDTDEPWHPGTIGSPSVDNVGPYYPPVTPDYYTFRPGPGSELGSTGYSVSDSAYFSAPLAAPSIKSGSFTEFSPDLSTLEMPLAEMDIMSIPTSHPSNATDDDKQDLSDPTLAATAKAKPKPSRGGQKKCEKCNEVLKCPSDYKKHMLKHDKRHKCDIPGCNRTDGFGTINDLNRHKSSVHKIRSSRSFKCAAPDCKVADKVWPRYDNFKQHVERMHKLMDVKDVIERSEIKAAANDDDGSQALERDLDGVGAGAESGIPVHSTIALEDLRTDPNQASSLYSGPPHTQYPNSLADAKPGHQSTDISDPIEAVGLQILSNLASVQQDLQPRQAENPSRTLDTIGSLVQKSLLEHQGPEPNEAVTKLRKINALFENNSNGHQFTSSTGSSDGESTSGHSPRFACRWEKCRKTFRRQCELNKHMKRHNKPYICTAVSCNHRCGSKFDWQRHEASCNMRGREFLDANESIRVCLEPDKSRPTGKCGFVHTSDKYFEEHLKEMHNLRDAATLKEHMQRSQPPNHKPGFGWCGFCLKSVRWSSTGAAGDTRNFQTGYGKHGDRADHIDWHVSREGKNMDQYVSLEYHLSKGQATPDTLQSWFQTESGRRTSNPRIQNPEYVDANPRKRKRAENNIGSGSTGSASDDEYRKKLNEAKWACCSCDTYQLFKLYPRCMGCDHKRCEACEDINVKRYAMKAPWDANKKYELNAL